MIRQVLLSLTAALLLILAVSTASLALDLQQGTFSVQMGMAFAEITNGFGASEGSATEFAWAADYKYPINERWSAGLGLLSWSFDDINNNGADNSSLSLCAMANYLLGSDRELYLGIGTDVVRMGGRFYFGNANGPRSGMFATAGMVFVTSSDTDVDSFTDFALGYSF